MTPNAPADPAASGPALGNKTRAWRDGPGWFAEHFEQAAGEIVEFIGEDGIDFVGKAVADIGCGDGIIDLGVAHRAGPQSLVGFDLRPTDVGALERLAKEHAGLNGLPGSLEFRRSQPTKLPAADGDFDIVYSWSAFEHIIDPVPLLREVRRVLKPSGVLMIQVWPFFHSQHGAHLPEWYPGGFVPFLEDSAAVEQRVRADLVDDPDWADERLSEYRTLNRITVDQLGRALLTADFTVAKLELLTERVHLSRELARYPLSTLGVAGVKLLAGHP